MFALVPRAIALKDHRIDAEAHMIEAYGMHAGEEGWARSSKPARKCEAYEQEFPNGCPQCGLPQIYREPQCYQANSARAVMFENPSSKLISSYAAARCE